MNVLIIPEDFRKDQYVLKPIIEAMLAQAGKPRANVRVCQDPLLGGVEQALKWERIAEILDRYRAMVHVFLLIVDRDGEPGRRAALDRIENLASENQPAARLLLAENAWQEIEVWALAGQDLPGYWSWQDVRNEVHPKETYFLPFAEQRGLINEPGQGRKTLARESARNYRRVRSRCPEDVGALEDRIREQVTTA
jgi:hypothetical protein